MKHIILFFLTTLLLAGCSSDDSNKNKLPPITQTGENTFGVTIKGKVYIPRDPTGVSVGPDVHAVIYTGGYADTTWRELIIVDGASSVGFKMIIHFKNLVNQGVGNYILKQSNFKDNIDSAPIDHIYFKIFDYSIGNYVYYGSLENQGNIIVTRFNGSLTQNWILSGTFTGKFAKYGDPNDVIDINDGRFDFNLNSLSSHVFP